MNARSTLLRRACAAAVLTLPAIGGAWADERGDDADELSRLSAQWWQWIVSIPAASSPFSEWTTADPPRCMVGQRGNVWFLGGTLGGGTASRRCSVPQGVTLFFPVLNNIQFNTPDLCYQTGPLTLRDIRRNLAPFIDAATLVSATVDSVPVKTIRRVRSVPFVTTLPADNVFIPFCPTGEAPPGVFSPSADDGYYARVSGLSVGDHVLHIKASSSGFDLDVVYQIKVVPVALR